MDYNAKGEQYMGIAFAKPNEASGLLPENGVRAILLAEKLCRDALKSAKSKEDPLHNLEKAFVRLEGVFFIAKRLIASMKDLPLRASAHPPFAPPPYMAMIEATDIFVDFSSLVYHASSTADILSKYYVYESGQKHTGHFRNSKEKIHNLQPVDIRANYLWHDLAKFEDIIDIIFTGSNGYKGLRNTIAHENSVLGMSSYTYAFHKLPDNRNLIFDCEIEIQNNATGASKFFPISRTIETIISALSWIVCRTAFCYLTRTKSGAILKHPEWSPGWGPEHFLPVWESRLAIFSDYIADDGEEMSTMKVSWSGCQIITRKLSKEVLEKAF